MSASDIDIVNNSYRKIKRSRGESVSAREAEFPKDPLYKSIYDMKHRAIKQVRARSQKNMTKTRSVDWSHTRILTYSLEYLSSCGKTPFHTLIYLSFISSLLNGNNSSEFIIHFCSMRKRATPIYFSPLNFFLIARSLIAGFDAFSNARHISLKQRIKVSRSGRLSSRTRVSDLPFSTESASISAEMTNVFIQ